MRFLADENCDRLIVETLRSAGHDVEYVIEFASGDDDPNLFRLSADEDRIFLTDDLDFGRLAERQIYHPPGIILMRLDPLSRLARIERLLNLLPEVEREIAGQLAVIEPHRIRYRRLLTT